MIRLLIFYVPVGLLTSCGEGCSLTVSYDTSVPQLLAGDRLGILRSSRIDIGEGEVCQALLHHRVDEELGLDDDILMDAQLPLSLLIMR